jgi:probable phosphoglycerate mutase
VTQLYLIRHGETMSAIQGLVGDADLSPLGILQAKRLRDRLAATREIAPDVLISSTYLRAQQTAQIIAPALGLPVILDDTIQEMRPGEAEGMPVDEFRKQFGEPDFQEQPFRPLAPGGESWKQFVFRIGAALDRIIHEYEGKTIVLVCHGGVIDGSFLYFFKMSAWTPPSAGFYTRNTSITHWRQVITRKNIRQWRLIKYNDAFHLHDIGTPATIPWGELSARPASDEDRPSVPLSTEESREREQADEKTTRS